MKKPTQNTVLAQWSRAGILFGTPAARTSPDPERLLLNTARHAPGNVRLFSHAVSWLAQYSNLIARHRLKRLATDELEPDARPTLGLLLDFAITHGASRELNLAADCCEKHDKPRILFDVHRRSPARRRLAKSSASPAAVARGLWAPHVEPATDALRPAAWIIQRNPSYRDRAIRKGDLRSTILETLRRDTPEGSLGSERELAMLCAANRPAVTRSLNDLEIEGIRLRHPDPNDRRRTRIRLTTGCVDARAGLKPVPKRA